MLDLKVSKGLKGLSWSLQRRVESRQNITLIFKYHCVSQSTVKSDLRDDVRCQPRNIYTLTGVKLKGTNGLDTSTWLLTTFFCAKEAMSLDEMCKGGLRSIAPLLSSSPVRGPKRNLRSERAESFDHSRSSCETQALLHPFYHLCTSSIQKYDILIVGTSPGSIGNMLRSKRPT